jgi:hypothetical protein
VSERGTGSAYLVVARGELSEGYASDFEGMRTETQDGLTILVGQIADRPHFYGILQRLNGLGLELLSVEALSEDALPPR